MFLKRPFLQRLISAPLMFALILQGTWLLPSSASAQTATTITPMNISNSPLSVVGGTAPNVLLVMDDSNSMDTAPDGTLLNMWSSNPGSRSYIARAAARSMIANYGTQMNIGLMSYQQPNNEITKYNLQNFYKNVSFDPNNHGTRDGVTPSPWNASNSIYYYTNNVGLLYSINNAVFYSPIGNQTVPTLTVYYTFSQKTNTSDSLNTPTLAGVTLQNYYADNVSINCPSPNANRSIYGSSYGCIYFTPTDSGGQVAPYTYGNWLAAITFGQAWEVNDNSAAASMGYLHVPIAAAPPGSQQATKLNTKLNNPEYNYGGSAGQCSSSCNGSNCCDANNWSNPAYPLENAGNTPMEGTLETAQAYFNGTAPLLGTAASQGLSGVAAPATQQCTKNYIVFMTDGLPSLPAGGYATGNSTFLTQDQLDTNVVTAAKNLLNSPANVKTYFIGFGSDVAGNGDALNSFAAAGGTTTAYSAMDANSLDSAFSTIFSSIQSQTLAASAVAANSTQLSTNSVTYKASYNPSDWSGHLMAYSLNANGAVTSTTPNWDAATASLSGSMSGTDATSRNIITYNSSANGGPGVTFAWSNLNATQQSQLGSANLLAWLRGDDTGGGSTSTTYRQRTATKLGDIVDSSPVYVGQPQMGYNDSIEPNASSPYSTFVTNNASRTPIVYVGANDGMLHGFDAGSGKEVFAYIPGAVYPNLAQLASPSYSHHFYVDGSPTVADACLGGSSCTWKTVLVGGLNAGGQGIYALDVTDPTKLGTSSVLWEFTDQNDSDLGDTFSVPQVVKLRGSGQWVAIFGNGYNNVAADGNASTTGDAVLYVVDLATGNLIKKFDTGIGVSASSAHKPNGLSTPAVLSTKGDGLGDYVYAGDLFGNMWKFDLTAQNANGWSVAFNGKPLYTATTAAGAAQPITVQPEISRQPQGFGGYMVYFGTGQSLEVGDNALTTPNTFYAIWDKGSAVGTGRTGTNLAQQTITLDTTGNYRVVSSSTSSSSTSTSSTTLSNGWYVDLPTSGERVINNPLFYDNRINFTTSIPAVGSGQCTGGGSGWLMELNPATGDSLSQTPFDVNGDGQFNSSDDVTIPGNSNPQTAVAGGAFINALPSAPVVLNGASQITIINVGGAYDPGTGLGSNSSTGTGNGTGNASGTTVGGTGNGSSNQNNNSVGLETVNQNPGMANRRLSWRDISAQQ